MRLRHEWGTRPIRPIFPFYPVSAIPESVGHAMDEERCLQCNYSSSLAAEEQGVSVAAEVVFCFPTLSLLILWRKPVFVDVNFLLYFCF